MKANDEALSNLEPTSSDKTDKNEEQPVVDEPLDNNPKPTLDIVSDANIVQGYDPKTIFHPPFTDVYFNIVCVIQEQFSRV